MKFEFKNSPRASLGFSSLILIALIVLIFSNSKGPDKKTLEQLNRLNNKIFELQQDIRGLQTSVDQLQALIKK